MSTKKINKELSNTKQDTKEQDNKTIMQEPLKYYKLFMIGLAQPMCVSTKATTEENARTDMLRMALTLVKNFNVNAAKQLEQDIMTLCNDKNIDEVSIDALNIALRLCNLTIICE